MSASQPVAQQLRTILDGATRPQFEGTGCSDHVRRRNLAVTVAVAAALLLVLLVVLVL